MNKRKIIVLVVLVIGLFFGNPLAALDPERAITQYIIDTWNDDTGLPQNSVLAILQTSDGYLWFGTEEGLARFDGAAFTTFDQDNTPEITNNHILSLYEDSRGNLWIGIRDGGLVRYKSGIFKRYTEKDDLLDDVVNCVIEGEAGDIWVGTQGGGLFKFSNNKFTAYTKKEGLPEDVVRSILWDSKGNLWIGTTNGLSCFRDNQFTNYQIGKDAFENLIRALFEDSRGNLWIGTHRGLFRMQNSKILPSRLNSDFPGIKIYTIFEDSDKNIWFGTDSRGLLRYSYEEGTFSILSEKNGLSDNAVMSIAGDMEGSLWVGTVYGGLNRLRDGKFVPFGAPEGLSDDIAFAVVEDGNHYLWIGTINGLNQLKNDGRAVNHFTTREGLSNNTVNTVYFDHQGFIWVGTDNGLDQFKHTESRILKVGKYLEGYVLAVLEDTFGNLWAGTTRGFFKLDKNSKELSKMTYKVRNSDKEAEVELLKHVNSLYEDRKKNVWISTYSQGLTKYREKTFTVYNKEHGLQCVSLNSFYEDSDSVLWIGTTNGLARFKDGKFTHYTKKDGLFNNNIYKILEDNWGNFWISCNKGIFTVRKKDLNDYAEGKIDSIPSMVYGKDDGMRSSECNGGFQTAGCKTIDGKLYFPTMKGIVLIDPGNLKTNPIPPPVVVEKVSLDGVPVPWGEKIVIGPDVKRVGFHYTALSFLVPERVKFKYRLQGFNRDWEDAGTLRVAYYTNLDAGDYRFQVMACNDDGVWNLQGASIAFSVIPPPWKTWWFTLLALTAFAFFSYMIINFFRKYFSLSSFWKKQKYVGKFKLLDKLGAGGMGTVYKAENLIEKGETVALKVLREELFEDERNRKRFKQEAAIIDQLDHPNIIRVYERGQSRHTMFIAMELLEGKTLTEKINEEGKVDMFDCLHIMVQVTDAIAKIHSKSIIHRDMKPDNVMLIERDNEPNFVKLLDFGLAKMQHQTRLTQTGMVIGTINYMAPEQIAGSGFSGATDIYSMGVVFYEMLTGEKPFVGETTIDIMKQIIDKTPIEPFKYRFDTPTELNDLILMMMEKKQKDRPKAEEVLEALKRIYTRLND